MAHVTLKGISKKFRSHTALSGLELDIASGEFFVLLGPTGAGKTTTLRLIAGLDHPDAGSIAIDEQDVMGWSAAERDVALVFQYYSLYPHYTVRQNLEFPLKSKVRRMSQAQIDERVAKAAKTLRIGQLLERKTDRLSGGEMQRVSIGRAIVREPKVFLMDEPLSNLDAKLREILRAELKDLQMKLGATFLYVTHDQVEAMSMGDKIGVLNQGRLIQVGTPQQIYNRPRDVFVATFVGSPAMNLLPATVSNGRAVVSPGELEVPINHAGNGQAGKLSGQVTLGIRSEDVTVGMNEAVEARVHGVENQGVEKIVTLRAGGCLIKGTIPARMELRIDSAIRFSFKQEKMHFFATESGNNLYYG
jgi:multiple sugar transport system ATP-binding protein